ncbi:STN domain-containing protein [Luteimonas sp. XNQY3]|nr:STN domain-containing protein [Luteimonas sp. XNQY3]MCD9007040.1 STN domain-containing protein [Luteimonas sp. XNQY3]
MANTIGFSRGLLLLALVLPLLGMTACVAADAKGKPFDIPAQPAAAALNEFARQADVTLIFSYDLVAGERTRPLKGSFAVDDGLTRLLDGTPLGYRQAVDGTYLICPLASCGVAPPAVSESPDPAGREGNVRLDSGNSSQARLQDKPVAMPGT